MKWVSSISGSSLFIAAIINDRRAMSFKLCWQWKVVKSMDLLDDMDRRILKAIYERSPTGWVFSVNVKSALRLEKKAMLSRLVRLKELGYIDAQSGSFDEGHLILKDGFNQLQLTDLGRSLLWTR